MNEEGLQGIGVHTRPQEQVMRLGQLAADSGVDGLVSSPLEIELLRGKLGKKPLLVTPGIRPGNAQLNEQKRVMSPEEAAKLGSSYIVVGRPIYESPEPAQAVANILESIQPQGATS